MGVPVIKSLKPKHHETILNWINNGTPVKVDYADNTREILEMIFKAQGPTIVKGEVS
jgi:hypothetical protein